ncbi:hypothetical protein GCM10023089_14550 [Quisquiliibacterium transsilvanicum]
MIALTALLWLNAGCATQGPPVDPFPVAADLAAPKVDRTGPRADDASPSGPVDPATIARLLAEAEDAYEGARWGQALEAFKAVTAFDSANPQAWLRIGNLHHRRGHLLAAASAYRKAGSGAQGEARLKALVNLASVNLELAGAALDEARALAGDGADTTATAREALGAELAGQADALERVTRARPWAGGKGAEADLPRSRGVERDRAVGRDRASAREAAAQRSAQPRPDPEPPRIEYLRGAPRP